jgi:monoamine oxidase
VKRRKAIKNIGLGLSAGLALPAWLTACKEEQPGPEIVYDGVVAIIGAGAAGLYAADVLHSKGIKVIIYEASNHIGGRVRSIRLFDDSPLNADFPIELGAERIYGTDSIWAKIIGQMNIPVVGIEPTNSFIIDGISKTESDLAGDADFVAAKSFINSLSTYSGADVSVQQAVQNAGLPSRVYGIVNAVIGNHYGTNNARISIRVLAKELQSLARNREESMLRSNPMQDVLASRFNRVASNVQLNRTIKKIDYSGTKIIIEGELANSTGVKENFSAEVDKVIVTVPVAVLKAGDIQFTPALPASKITALSKIGMDAAIRIFIDFKQNFWGEATGFIYSGNVAPEFFNTGVGRSEHTKTLSVTIQGEKAEALMSKTDDEIVTAVLTELDAAFSINVDDIVRKDANAKPIYTIMRWHETAEEPYIKGSISYVKPGGTIEDRTTLGQSVQEVLFFAGEATHDAGEAGTVNGALLSGERVAQAVINTIV